jgi:hypothetical protein
MGKQQEYRQLIPTHYFCCYKARKPPLYSMVQRGYVTFSCSMLKFIIVICNFKASFGVFIFSRDTYYYHHKKLIS